VRHQSGVIDLVITVGDDSKRQHHFYPFRNISALRMFSYIVPKTKLLLHAVGAVYKVNWERSCGCKRHAAPTSNELVTIHDNHIQAWYRWKKEQKRHERKQLRDLQEQDNLNAAVYRKTVRERQQRAVDDQKGQEKQ
jgi:hypothetical protein